MPKQIDLNGGSTSLTIPVSGLQAMVDKYKNKRYNYITEYLKSDARAAWVSKKKMTEFFENNPAATGVRMYYGVVDDANFSDDGVHNLLLVSTAPNATATDNQDLIADNDWVMVLQNFYTKDADSTAQSAICPPPQPCPGPELDIANT